MRNLLGKGMTTWGMMALLFVVPLVFFYTGNPFYLDLATRLIILAIAAVGLNFVLGYGGLISFGHAAFIGLGAYAVGIPVYHEIYGGWDAVATTNGFAHFGLAILIGALFALITGAISLKVRGVHFIMITMAFAQMIYYLVMSISEYGGDDGLVIDMRSEFPLISLDDPIQFFLIAFASLALVMWLVHLMVNSRFGMVLRGSKGNETRMISLGYPTYRYRLVAYVISGAICGYAGALLGNFTAFISPEMMDWSRSGNLMFMVILGGVATIFGPVLGATVFIVLEEILSTYTVYWHLPFGLMLVLVVMYSRGGLTALLQGKGGK
ncbi:branched-chain amino acid ABC transporter permease [Marinobacterium sp. LSUCC0821]|jgi:branched-chain amino acid transport system permease protein|uniref:branched-chain amino acid ABC transporter permease n=1 Tax=Marinobacterium sp. LSUCC0821 TaxID=2668067 RepID=UPI001451EC8B|nr:branched-chain amino acid ABC transporter permease [Marinobacterium sp. LSUCC0821]QJD71432.1 branched-chain amino acid ABC transporter permease [Marinobacterium sp. LSUCC0821]